MNEWIEYLEPGDLSGLPAELAQECGIVAARALLTQFGGRNKLYIPTADRLGAQHELCRTLGDMAAKWLARRYGGDRVAIPLRGLKARAFARARAAGVGTIADLARQFGYGERSAYRILAEAGNTNPL